MMKIFQQVQTQSSACTHKITMSAYLQKAGISCCGPHAGFVPTGDIERARRPKEKGRPEAALNFGPDY
jgi:hypothetical protein